MFQLNMAERSSVDVSWRTIGRILIAVALVWAWLQLWQFAMVIVVAIVMAVALDPVVRKLEERGVPRWVGAFGSVLAIGALAAVVIAASWVSITQQSEVVVENVSGFYDRMRESFPLIDRLAPAAAQGGSGIAQYGLAFGRSVVNAIGMFIVGLVLTVYLLIEWKATLDWVVAFFPSQHRPKIRRTASEARQTVFKYVVGNAITSAITAAATFVALLALKVPAALVLALIAGIFDFVPIVGFLLSLAVTGMLAATVSLTALIGVIVFYVAFNAVENYFIMPKVYGRELELSNLAVLVAVAVGAQLGGVMGALLALPVAAIYPAIERIWLRQQLSGDTVELHQRLSSTPGFTDKVKTIR
jgi:predicted PurR-regulated permease PerM